MYTEEPPRGLRARLCEGFNRLIAGAGHRGGDVRKIHRLVPARGRLGVQVAPHQLQQMRPPPLVTDPTGDADRQPELEITLELRGAAGETVRDAPTEGGPMLAQDGDEVRVGIALMQEYGLATTRCELQLTVKGLPLGALRGVVAIVVESTLTHGDDLRGDRQVAELRETRGQLGRVMRMHARGREQPASMLSRERDRRPGAGRGR